VSQCNWQPSTPAGCTPDGVSRDYNGGVAQRAACCSGLTENSHGTCGCPAAPQTCTNGATNYPTCTQCSSGESFVNSECIFNCQNGGTNPPTCNQCPSGKTLIGGVCTSTCTNGATNVPTCSICPTGYSMVNNVCTAPCTNGSINSPTCNVCPSGFTLINNQCLNNCTNGAMNPGVCNVCLEGFTLLGGVCTLIVPAGSGGPGGSLPDTGIFSDRDGLIIGFFFLLIGILSVKFNLISGALHSLNKFEQSVKRIPRITFSLDESVKSHKRNSSRTKYEKKFKYKEEK